MEIESNIVNDRGSDKSEAQEMLRTFCENGFNGDAEKAGLAIGRHASEIREMVNGDLDIDDDLEKKIREIAKELGIKLS
jgi:hypothetical protein